MKNANFMISAMVFGLMASATAFADASYECVDLESQDNNHINIEIPKDGQTIHFLDKTSLVSEVKLNKDVDAPAGYTAFTGTGGCPATGAIRCFAVTEVTLMVSHELLEGAMQGDVIYDSQSLRCGMLLK